MELRGEASKVLSEGDRITASISHQIRVDGDESWVKYEVNAAVMQGETSDQAKTRVKDHVNATAMEFVHEVVDKIRGV